jgi:MFS family permease
MATPSAIGLIAENFEEGRTRSICYACYGAGAPVGAAVGVVMGGLLAEYVE